MRTPPAARALAAGLAAAVVLAGLGCVQPGDAEGVPDARDAREDRWVPGCSERAESIYLLDVNRKLLRFRPDALAFEVVGTLRCPVHQSEAVPFAMTIDRDGTAWVVYYQFLGEGGAELFRVSTVDAACAATGFVPNQEGFELFSLAFASDAEGSEAETLHVVGGPESGTGVRLGRIDVGSLLLTPIGAIPPGDGWPDLTGTGSGALWGFFPGAAVPPRVRGIDKATGAAIGEGFPLPGVDSDTVQAWAFAFWGGDFWLFVKLRDDWSTNVWRLDPDDGSFTEVLYDIGWFVSGAGVSTCAPVILL